MGIRSTARMIVGAARSAKVATAWLGSQAAAGRSPREIGQEVVGAVTQALQELGVNGKEALKDEAILEKTVERAHGILPFWMRAVVPRTALKVLVRKLDDRIHIQDGIVRLGDGALDVVLKQVSRDGEPSDPS